MGHLRIFLGKAREIEICRYALKSNFRQIIVILKTVKLDIKYINNIYYILVKVYYNNQLFS